MGGAVGGEACCVGSVVVGVEETASPTQRSSTLTPMIAASAIADPVGIELLREDDGEAGRRMEGGKEDGGREGRVDAE